MSFCRITGKSRNLPKANYFPIIPPISPGDARRFCRITGKSYGLPTHNYIPVKLISFASRKKCRVTNEAPLLGRHHYLQNASYGKRKHIVLLDYRYVLPSFNFDCETQKELHDIFNVKEPGNENKFVYRVDEKRCNLVFPAKLEAAVRDGDIRDIMFAKDSDQILFRTKAGNDVSVDLVEYKENLDQLYEGEGPKEEVIVERELELKAQEKKKRRVSKISCNRQQLKSITQMFENKDMAQIDEEEEEESKRKGAGGKKKAKALKNVPKNVSRKEVQKMKKFMENVSEENSKKLQDLVKPMLESWDWDMYEHEAKELITGKNIKSTVTKKMKALNIPPAKIKVKSRVSEFENNLLDNTVGFECIPLVGCYKRPNVKPLVSDLKLYQTAPKEMMKKLANVVEKFQKADFEVSSLLPSEYELFDVLQNITKGNKSELNGVPGCQIDIEDRRVFLPGEFIQTEKGEVFCPGQAVVDKKSGKSKFAPGLTTFDPESQNVSFIAGQVMTSKDNQVQFQAGLIIKDEFHCGQTIYVNDEPKFIEGETIVTPEGFKFVAGVYDESETFTPGKFMTLPSGEEKFIPGQMTDIFISGQNVLNEKTGEWSFVSGQTIIDDDGGEIFVSGITIQTDDGSKFIAGMHNEEGNFIPGITKKVGKEMKFFPGITIETKQGLQFCEGQMVQSAHGEIFMPGKTEYKTNGEAEFKIAESIDQIAFQKPLPSGMVIDPHSLEVAESSMSVFGHMVQTEFGIEFYPEKVLEENLPMGKMIPGKLIKKGNETKFIPGIKADDGSFTPGQVVNTPDGEEFVCGQLVETANGPKFMPGQVITLKNGEMKFVPGVTDRNGRFVPGQILDTIAGPTFIPGQICYTGQVVETASGPCFVPGRIVETDDKVTFIAGQVVETPDGLRFIAPDMKNDGTDFEFNLQGFAVTPEELALIKPKNNFSPSYMNSGDFSIDAVLMRQLSEAGMSIGRQVETAGVDLVLQSTLNREIVEKFCEDLPISFDVADSIFKMIKTLTDEHKGKITAESLTAKILELCMPVTPPPMTPDLEDEKTSKAKGKKKPRKSVAFNDPTQSAESHQIVHILTKVMMEIFKNEEIAASEQDGSSLVSHHHLGNGTTNGNGKHKVETVYEIISNVLRDSMGKMNLEQLETVFSSANMKELVLEKLNNTIGKVETMCRIEEMKQNLLSSAFGVVSDIHNGGSGRPNGAKANGGVVMPHIMVNDNDFVIEQFCDMVEDYDVSSAFSAMTKNNPQLMLNVLNAIQTGDISNPNMPIKELIQKAIIAAVNEENNRKIEDLLTSQDASHVETVLNEALLLAKVLGLNSEAMTLLSAIDKASKSGVAGTIELDEAAKSVVRRVCVMRQLAEVDPDYFDALELLNQSPRQAVKDEIVRELVRKSGLISIDAPKKQTIESSNDIPMSLLADDNVLAMEDFMLRNGTGSRAFLIIKDGIQCVVPREKSHDVLTGKCAYTVLDENGIRHFEPLHVMSALKMNTATQHHRFSIYANDTAIEEISKLRRSSCSPTYDTQARDFQYSACDFVDNLDANSSNQGDESGEPSENGEFGEFFVENVNYEVDQETGYRRPRRRRNNKDDPTSNLDFQTTQMLRKRRGARPDRKSKSPITTQVYRQYTQVNDNIYIMHAYVYHSKDKNNQKATR